LNGRKNILGIYETYVIDEDDRLGGTAYSVVDAVVIISSYPGL